MTRTRKVDVQVVVRPEHVGGNRGGKVAAILILVGTDCIDEMTIAGSAQYGNILVRDINHSLRMSVSEITLVWQAKVNLALVERVSHFIGEHTCREAGDDFLGLREMSGVQDVVVDEHVVAEESELRCMKRHEYTIVCSRQ